MPLQLLQVFPSARIKHLKKAFGVVQGVCRPINRQRLAPANEPQFFHQQREARNVVGMGLGEDKVFEVHRIEAGCQHALRNVAAAIDNDDIVFVRQGQHRRGAVRLTVAGASAE